MTMANETICVADETRRRFAVIGLAGGKPARLDATPSFAAAIDRELARLAETGLRARVESIGGDRIGVDFRPVKSGDPRYPEAVAEFFRGLGYSARLLGERQARVWLALQTLPVDEKLRADWLPVLGGVPDDEAEELLAALREAAGELAGAVKKASARSAAVNAKAAEYKKEIEDQFRQALGEK